MLWTLFRLHRRPKIPAGRKQRFAPRLEALEDRTLLDAGLQEEYALELLNRMRTNPQAELPLLLNSNDPDVNNALSFFNVDRQLLAQQWSTLTPVPPLAWSDTLAGTALAHSQLMRQDDQQSHQLPGEPDLGHRLLNAGYNYFTAGENIFAYATSIFDNHAGLAIDWGGTSTGIQNPPAHRENIMDAAFREVGIGLVTGIQGHQTGPLLITEDFGTRFNPGNPFLVGAVFADANGDGFYSQGEGVAGVNVSVSGTGGTFTTTTSAAGGYQLQLPAGTYTATFSGGGLAAPVVQPVTVAGVNVLLNVNTSLATTLQFSSATYTASETGGRVTVTVTRTGGSGTFTVRYATSDGSARAGTDYTATGGTLTFNPGDTSKTFTITILNDGLADGNETVNLTLSNATGGAKLGSPSTAVLTITDLPTGGGPVPTPVPPVVPGLTARLVSVKVGKKKARLMVEVLADDTGALKEELASPFQKPAFKNIRVSVRDSNGDGVPDQVIFTAKKGKRTVTAIA
jgi:uncharacterized protein YkwD